MIDYNEERRKCLDPSYFRSNYFLSLDGHDRTGFPWKLVPDKPHLRFYDWLLRGCPGPDGKPKCRFACIWKSRQLMISIATTSHVLNEARTMPGVNIVLQSDILAKAAWGGPSLEGTQQQGDYAGLLTKIDAGWQRLPAFLRWREDGSPLPYATSKSSSNVIRIGHKRGSSTIRAVSSNFSSAAGATLYRYVMDEVSLQPDAESSFGTARPALGSTGLCTMIGTTSRRRDVKKASYKGFLYKTLYNLASASDKFRDKWVTPPYSRSKVKIQVPIHAQPARDGKGRELPGIWYWLNEEIDLKTGRPTGNQFVCAAIHYSSDPDKANPDWADAEHAGTINQSKWDSEMEMQWTAVELGVPNVCPKWSAANISDSAKYDPALGPVIRAMDYGLEPACIWGQVDPKGVLRVFDCFRPHSTERDQFVEGIIRRENEMGYGKLFENYGDVAGRHKTDASKKTTEKVMEEAFLKAQEERGVHYPERVISRGKLGRIEGINLVNLKVGQRIDGIPGVLVNPDRGRMLIDALSTLEVNTHTGEVLNDNDLVHVWDAFKYLVCNKWRSVESIYALSRDQVDSEKEEEDKPDWAAMDDNQRLNLILRQREDKDRAAYFKELERSNESRLVRSDL